MTTYRRRVRRVIVAAKLIEHALVTGHEITEGGVDVLEGLPEGAQLVGISLMREDVTMLFEHASFAEVSVFEPPILVIKLQKTHAGRL